MDRRVEMQMVLDKEVKRWSEMSAAQLLTELAEMQNYEIECNGKRFQFEVQIWTTDDFPSQFRHWAKDSFGRRNRPTNRIFRLLTRLILFEFLCL
jgi:hypothetical protein